MKQIYYVLALLIITIKISSQSRETDSLKLLLNNTMHDTVRLDILSNITDRARQGEEIYYKEMQTIATKNIKQLKPGSPYIKKYLNFLAEADFYEGTFLVSKMKLPEALAMFKKGMEESKQLNDSMGIATCKLEIAKIYTMQEDYKTAIETFYEALKLLSPARYQKFIANIYTNIGRIYQRQENYEKAIEFYQKSYNTYESVNYKGGMLNSFTKLAALWLRLKDTAKAISYFEKCEVIVKNMSETERTQYEIHVNESMAKLNDLRGNNAKALEYLNKSISILEKTKILIELGNVYAYVADIYQKEHNYAKAVYFSNKALNIDIKNHNDFGQFANYNRLYKLYKIIGDNKNALEMHEHFMLMSDSIKNKKDEKHVIETELKHEFEKKELLTKIAAEKKINEINLAAERKNAQSKILLLLLALGLVLFAVAGCFVYYYYRQKSIIHEQENDLLHQRLLLSQMNPHFIFNSLSSIQAFLLAEDPVKTSKYLANLSKLIRTIFENSRKEYISLKEEIQCLQIYLELEQMRSGRFLSFEIKFGDAIDQGILIPPMLIQPHIENALKHGLNKITRNTGKITISFYHIKSDLFCSIEDNGIGINTTRQITKSSSHSSAGIEITVSRLKQMCKDLGFKYSLFITDKTDIDKEATGTIVSFLLPYSKTGIIKTKNKEVFNLKDYINIYETEIDHS